MELPPSSRISLVRNSQRGAILVFFAMVMIVLLGFIALVLDTGIGESGRGEEQTAVQNAALAGMSAYLETLKSTPTPGGGAEANRYERARTAAKTTAENILAASNRISKGYRLNPNTATRLGDGSGAEDGRIVFGSMVWAMSTPAPGAEPSERDAEIIASCSQGSNLKLPCFIPQTESELSTPATAIEVSTTSRSNPIKTVFARVFGTERYEVGGSAISTLIPQNYLFLLDLSSSMVDQTYRRFGVRDESCPYELNCQLDRWFGNPSCYVPASASYFAYDVNTERAAEYGCDSPGTRGTCGCFSAPKNVLNCLRIPLEEEAGKNGSQTEETGFCADPRDYERRRARRIFSGYSDWWLTTDGLNYASSAFPADCTPASDTRSQCPAEEGEGSDAVQCKEPWTPAQTPPRSFYRLVYPNFGNDLVTNNLTTLDDASVLVDFGQDENSNAFASSPEPLRSVLDATNDAMDFIKQRAVSADRFFLTGFDEDILAARTTCEDNSLTTCLPGKTLVPGESTSFDQFFRLTSVKDSVSPNWRSYDPNDTSHFLNRAFFPRVGYNTDIVLALWKTYEELVANPSGSSAKNLVFLVTDGIANCRYVDGGDSSGVLSFGSLNEYVSNRVCDGNPSTIGLSVVDAIRQMNRNLVHRGYNKSLVQLFQERGIAVSVILIGRNVQPHYLARKSTAPGGAGGCLTGSEATYGDLNFVDWSTSYTGDTYECTPVKEGCTPQGLFASRLADDARAALIDPQGAATLPISNLLYNELVAPTRGAWIPILPQRVPGNQTLSNFNSALQTACNNAPAEDGKSKILENLPLPTHGQVTDGQGRLLYDPLGRSQKDQIIDQVRQVLGGGYVLVEPAMRAN